MIKVIFQDQFRGGCVEGDVVRQSIELLSKPENFKKLSTKFLMKVPGK